MKALDKQTPFNQKKRAWQLAREIERLGLKVRQINEESISFGKTTLVFFPSFHGSAKLGRVLVLILKYRDDCTLVFAPDVQGPVDDATFKKLLTMKFDLAIVGGPPLYLKNRSEELSSIAEKGLVNLAALVRANPHRVVVSHHLLRSPSWIEALEHHGASRNDLLTYSAIRGVPHTLLEASRKLLYESDPPPPSYESLLVKHKGEKCTKLLHALG